MTTDHPPGLSGFRRRRPRRNNGDEEPGPITQAQRVPLDDGRLVNLVAEAKLAEGYDSQFPFALETMADVARFAGEVRNSIPGGYEHLIEQICVWPNDDEPDGLITIDLPGGLRLASLCTEARTFISDRCDADTRQNVEFALTELLYQGRRLIEDYRRAQNTSQPLPWWRRHGARRVADDPIKIAEGPPARTCDQGASSAGRSGTSRGDRRGFRLPTMATGGAGCGAAPCPDGLTTTFLLPDDAGPTVRPFLMPEGASCVFFTGTGTNLTAVLCVTPSWTMGGPG